MILPSILDIDLELARRSLLHFTKWTMPDYAENWHNRLMFEYLDAFVAGEIKRLMIFMPPRSGKSEAVSRRLPAYILGRDPDATIIAASYGADLARRMNRDVQRIMDDPKYQEVFPETKLFGKNIRALSRDTWLRNSDMFEVVGRKGYYRGSGVGGAITGMGFHYGIIDDPIKNRKEADSTTFRQSIEEWYTSTFYTRRAPNAAILLTVTRWHEDDLAGRLLAKANSDPKADQWEVLKLPAIAEAPVPPYDPRQEGDPLWPQRFDMDDLAKTEIAVGSYDWAALYQQRPAPATGGILKRHWWKYWKPKGSDLPPVIVNVEGGTLEIEAVELPSGFDDMAQTWDCAFKDTKNSDFVAGQVWARKGANKYCLDYVNKRLDIIKTMKAIQDWDLLWPAAVAKLIEDKANGPAVIQMLRDKVAGLIPVEPDGGKVSRAYAAAPEVEAGNVFLPHPALYGWVDGFVNNAAAFPNGAHDDDIDAFTQVINRWRANGQTAVAQAQVTSKATIDRLFG
jgi:predicted phage terminase large subunit-like protein